MARIILYKRLIPVILLALLRCLGNHLTTKVVGEVLKAVMALPKVRRANGQSGTLTRSVFFFFFFTVDVLNF